MIQTFNVNLIIIQYTFLANNMKKMYIPFHILSILMFVFTICVNAQYEIQNKIKSLELKIADVEGNIIYPFYPQQLKEFNRCGAVSSIKFYNQQIIYVQANKPFVSTIYTESTSVKISGYAESTQSEVPGKYIALMIVTHQCNSYFTEQKYITYLKISEKTNISVGFYEQSNYLLAQINSIAYCLSELELKSLQQAFNIGYTIMLLVVASMLPTFPLGKLSHKITLLILLFMSQLSSMQQVPLIQLSCFLVIINPLSRNQINLQIETQKAYRLFKSSLISLFLFYILMYFINYFSLPYGNPYSQHSSFLYTAQLYIQNSIKMLIILQLFSSIIWINRLRSFFWWTVLVMFVYMTWIKDSNLLKQKSYIFGVILPSIFTQRCQYRSMILNILMMPVCQYMDRFNKVKFGGLLVMIALSLFGTYSDVLGLSVSVGIILLWFILGISQEGYVSLITRRWLSLSDIQVIER